MTPDQIKVMEDPLKTAREAYTGSTSYFDANIRGQIERDIRQFQGRHAADSKYHSDTYKARSKLFRPKTRSAIRKNEAIAAEAFFSTVDTVNIAPENEADDVQAVSSEVMKALIQHRLTKTVPWFLTCIAAYQEAQTVGVVISHQYWEYDAKRGVDRPAIKLLPVENFRFDPAADWTDPINTSPYLIELMPMYVKDIKAKMGKGKWKTLTDQELMSGCKPWDTTRLERDNSRADNTDRITAINDFTIAWVHRNVVEVDGEDLLFYTLGTTHLLSEPIPLDEHVATGERPYVLGICMIEAHRNYPSSLPKVTRDVQVEINEITNQRIDNVKFVLNKRYFVKRNRQVDLRSLSRNVPGSSTLLTDPETDVKVVDTPDVTASSFSEQDRLNLDFDDLAGSFSQASVQSNRKLNETVGGMNILTSNANQISGYQLRTFTETWVEPVLRQLVKLEYCYETDERILRLVGEKIKLFERYGQDAMVDEFIRDDLTVTVNVGMSATSPTDKVNTLMLALNSLRTALSDGILAQNGIDPMEIIKEVLGAIGYRDGGKFVKKDGEEDPRIAVLEQQIQQLQQALEAKHPPELIAAQVKELGARAALINKQAEGANAKKVKDGVEATYAAMQAAEVVAAEPLVAPVADKIMEIAGYVPPNPVGVDPNFIAPAQPVGSAANVATMMGADQAMQDSLAAEDAGNTDPMSAPNAPTAGQGERAGIETQRVD